MFIKGENFAEGKIALDLLRGSGSSFQIDTALHNIAEQAGSVSFLMEERGTNPFGRCRPQVVDLGEGIPCYLWLTEA